MDFTPAAGLVATFNTLGLEIDGVCDDLHLRAATWSQGSALIEDLLPDEAAVLGSLMPKLRAKAGQVLVKEGDVGDWMLLLLSGTVDVTKSTPESRSDSKRPGEPSRLAVIRTGAAVGEMSMLDGSPRYATCTALQDLEACVLTRATVAHLIDQHPRVGAKLLVKLTQILAQRLRNTSNQVVKLVELANQRLK